LLILWLLSSSSSILSHVHLGFADCCSLRSILYCSEYPHTILQVMRIADFMALCMTCLHNWETQTARSKMLHYIDPHETIICNDGIPKVYCTCVHLGILAENQQNTN
jgi:hypothetical protein